MGLIEGAGTPESTWQRWLPEAGLGSTAFDAWVRPDARLVVLAPHPDDEVLACGGLLALHAARGGRCLIVGATDGDASEAGLDDEGAARLAARRRAERRAGLAELGMQAAEMELLGLPDGRLADHRGQLLQALRGLLDAGDVLVTTWRHDGHPDHEACGRAAAAAAEASGSTLLEAPVWMWHWARPGDPRVPWRRLVSLALPETVRRRRQLALAAHASQLAPRGGNEPPVLGDEAVARMRRGHEHYLV